MKNSNQTLGSLGEKEAVKFLKKQHYKILELNYRTYYGEIDIIAKQKQTYVFVEVKTRSSDYVLGNEAVNLKKQKNIIASAESFLDNKRLFDVDYRFDIIEVLGSDPKIFKINHLIDAFA